MSNHRKTGLKNLYRQEFLRSPVWFGRRDRWFASYSRDGRVHCAACGEIGNPDQLELHHRDYRGVRITRGAWQALEADSDLVPLHPYCHELLHRLIDRDLVLAAHRSRRHASDSALASLRITLHEQEKAS